MKSILEQEKTVLVQKKTLKYKTILEQKFSFNPKILSGQKYFQYKNTFLVQQIFFSTIYFRIYFSTKKIILIQFSGTKNIF